MEFLPSSAGWLTIVLSASLFTLLITGLHLLLYRPDDIAQREALAALLNGQEPTLHALWMAGRYAAGAGAHGITFTVGLFALAAYDRLTVVGVLLLLWLPWATGGTAITVAHWLRAEGHIREIAGTRASRILETLDVSTDHRTGSRPRSHS